MNLDLLRTLAVIAETGSLNRAAEKLRVSQSTLTRQIQALEQELGGNVLERSNQGVALTAAGHRLHAGMASVLERFEAVWADAQALVRGQSARLNVGYVVSAAADFLHPALAHLRKAHPEVKVKLFDLSPGEQARALEKGELDVGLVALSGTALSRDFYVRRLGSFPIVVAMSDAHRLAREKSLRLRDLSGEHFMGARDEDMPGHNRWLSGACRKAGFRARFLQDAESMTEGLATVVTENAVSLVPAYITGSRAPGVTFVPLREPGLGWELHAVWQRGKPSGAVKVLVEAFPTFSAHDS